MLWLLFVLTFVGYTDGFRSVCYYTNWAQYRHGKGLFYPENVDPFLCSHVVYAFAKPSGLDIQPFEWNDESTQWSVGMYERIMKLKEKNPSLQILLAVGGYNMGSLPFIPVVASTSSRSTFAKNAVTFLRQKKFDGLDVDWEYPGTGGSTADDKDKLVLLMQELRNAFEVDAQTSGQPRLLLTGALPAGKNNIDIGFNVPALLQYMDFISIMTYDLHGSWEPYTGLNSPLYAHPSDVGKDAYLNLDWVAQYYLSLGAVRDKVNIGIALYGRSFTLDNPNQHDIRSPAGQPGDPGLFTGEKGFISYYEICDLINSGAQVVDVPSQRSRYLYKGRLWVGYDDLHSIKEKACYTKENGFGGVMFWSLDLDDFSGQTCGQGTYPLITAVKSEMSNPSLANCVKPSAGPQVTFNTPPSHTNTLASPTPAIISTHDFDCINKADDFYPDLHYCNRFFICTNQAAYEGHCGTGLLFNPTSKNCENDYLTVCESRFTSPAYRETTKAVVTSPSTICIGHTSGTLPHPTNCQKFFLCTDGNSNELDCQGSMVFNPAKGACDFSTCTLRPILG